MVELRERTEENVRIYFRRTRDPEIQAMLHQEAQTVEQALESYRMTLLPGADSYGRTIYADGAYVGDVWCYGIDPAGEPNAMVGYCVFEKDLWGRGLATAALGEFLEDAADRFGLKTVGAFAWRENRASLGVLEKNGFRQVEAFTEEGREAVYCQKEIR